MSVMMMWLIAAETGNITVHNFIVPPMLVFDYKVVAVEFDPGTERILVKPTRVVSDLTVCVFEFKMYVNVPPYRRNEYVFFIKLK